MQTQPEAAEGRRGRYEDKRKIRSGDPAMQSENKGNMSLYKNTTKTIMTTPLLSTGAGPEGGIVIIPLILVNINNREDRILSTPLLFPAPVEKIGVVK